MIYGPEEWKLWSIAHAQEVICINGPGHDPSQSLVPGVLCLGLDGPLIVVAQPLVTSETKQWFMDAYQKLDNSILFEPSTILLLTDKKVLKP